MLNNFLLYSNQPLQYCENKKLFITHLHGDSILTTHSVLVFLVKNKATFDDY